MRCIDLKTIEKAIVDVARYIDKEALTEGYDGDLDEGWCKDRLCQIADAIAQLLGEKVTLVKGHAPLERLCMEDIAFSRRAFTLRPEDDG